MKLASIPAQIRAGRALLDWSQEELANRAAIGLSSVKDTESLKRPADSGAANAMRGALENAGVLFVSGDDEAGPGVRLANNRPNYVRRPSTATIMKWDGLHFEVELRGKIVTVFVSTEALEDLDRLSNPSNESLMKSFENHEGRILDTVVSKMQDPRNIDDQGWLRIRTRDFSTRP